MIGDGQPDSSEQGALRGPCCHAAGCSFSRGVMPVWNGPHMDTGEAGLSQLLYVTERHEEAPVVCRLVHLPWGCSSPCTSCKGSRGWGFLWAIAAAPGKAGKCSSSSRTRLQHFALGAKPRAALHSPSIGL